MSTIITHTMRGNFCTICNETREWLIEHNGVMVEVVDASEFKTGDIIQIGKGARRWLVIGVEESGRITLDKMAAKGERSSTIGVAPGLRYPGVLLGNNHRYLEASEQGNLTRTGQAQPLPHDHEMNVRERELFGQQAGAAR